MMKKRGIILYFALLLIIIVQSQNANEILTESVCCQEGHQLPLKQLKLNEKRNLCIEFCEPITTQLRATLHSMNDSVYFDLMYKDTLRQTSLVVNMDNLIHYRGEVNTFTIIDESYHLYLGYGRYCGVVKFSAKNGEIRYQKSLCVRNCKTQKKGQQ